MEDEEHEVYGGEIPDEGEMEADADIDMPAAEDDAAVKVIIHPISQLVKFCIELVVVCICVKLDWICDRQELDEMKKRLKQMEEEAAALREMQAKVEKEMGSVQGPSCFFIPFFSPLIF